MEVRIKKFSEIGIMDIGIVGGKNASLGEMYNQLSAKGVRIPKGFATTYKCLLSNSAIFYASNFNCFRNGPINNNLYQNLACSFYRD